jgi:hypothetical protein
MAGGREMPTFSDCPFGMADTDGRLMFVRKF